MIIKLTILCLGVLLAVLAPPAQAQHVGRSKKSAATQQTAEQKKKAEEAEKNYKAALDSIPDKKPADPWGGVR
jgi:hypothetical protein